MKHTSITILICLVFYLLTSCSDSSTTPHADMLSPKPESAMLIVKRLDPLHQSDTEFEKSIQDEADVKKLYEKISSLPSFPQTFISCPADNGVEYEMTFIFPSQSASKASVRATGCQQVMMNEKTYWAMEPKGNGFIALLEHVLRLNNDQFSVGFASQS
ncbi:hypothetical protein [Cohnella rhizosphaerae]|uniref:Lipoprotein n=1 Tax=Cohnella rhizosphaerae TaxID=1457232 RepID=A0A9X4QWY1_9BACL|nr:hypothetical protein [Cohnella rhizosphaerae]MDG0814018.1 hypothetical protein [Cohnella rhizosphaerae]